MELTWLPVEHPVAMCKEPASLSDPILNEVVLNSAFLMRHQLRWVSKLFMSNNSVHDFMTTHDGLDLIQKCP